MLSGPERTRRTEPCWGKASLYSRATRLPVGRRRGERAPSGRTLLSGSTRRHRRAQTKSCGQPCGSANSCFEPVWGDSTEEERLIAPLNSLLFSASLKARSPVRFSIGQQAA